MTRENKVNTVTKTKGEDVTLLLKAGDVAGAAALLHGELRKIARRHMSRERPGHILQPTALVNELYIRMVDQTRVQWADRKHFLAIAASQMRRILVDHARRARASKRDGGQQITLNDALKASSVSYDELLAIDEALARLAKLNPHLGHLVELRFFGGLTLDEAAQVLEVSRRTAVNEWGVARGWLKQQLSSQKTL